MTRTRIVALEDDPNAEAALKHVARNMREWDRREIFATRWTDDPDELADDLLKVPGFAWLAYRGETPVAAIGGLPARPNVWAMWAFGTDRFGEVGLALTRHAVRFMTPALLNFGVHRADALSMAGHTEAHRWLEAMGFVAEADIKALGKNREDFVLYAWRA